MGASNDQPSGITPSVPAKSYSTSPGLGAGNSGGTGGYQPPTGPLDPNLPSATAKPPPSFGSIPLYSGPTATGAQINQQNGLDSSSRPIGGGPNGALGGPGAAETYYDLNKGFFTTPTAQTGEYGQDKAQLHLPGQGETFATSAVDTYGNGKNPQPTNNAYDAYKLTLGDRPDIAADPGLTPYFNNAERRAGEDINKAMASRGLYGSSAATDQLSEMYQNMEGQKASQEANYHLQRLGEQRAWDNLSGDLAKGADTSSLAQAANTLDWTRALGSLSQGGEGSMLARLGLGGGLAGGADSSSLAAILGGMGAAEGAQGAEATRFQNMFGNEMSMDALIASLMTGSYNGMFNSDQTNFENSMGMSAGAATEQQNQERLKEERVNKEFPIVGGML